MSGRIARKYILYNGCYAHVISRSIRQINLFKDCRDMKVFKNLLLDEKGVSGFRIFHYCLMHTHFHLAVKMPDVELFSKSMSRVKSKYALAYHIRYRLSGPIWRGRFKSLLVENERYLFSCGNYIENNPIRAGLVERARDWPHSSYRFYNDNEKDDLVDGYEKEGNPAGFLDKEMQSEKDFEKGDLIGSAIFKFQLLDKRKSI